MQPTSFFKQPLFWLASVGVVLLLMLAFWYVKRPTDATGKSLILSRGEQRKVEKDLAQRATQRRQDSVQATQAQAAATTLYQEGQQQQQTATHLRQQTHERHASTPDTGAQQLQRVLTNY